jgi:phosphonate transport system substrate-binding protein
MHHLSRRSVLAASLLLAGHGPALADQALPVLRVGLTPVFLDNQVAFLNQWRAWLEGSLRRQLQFVQRGSYRDVVALLLQGQLDFAWLCGYPFVRNKAQMKLLAVPLYRGAPLYQSYLIVPAGDRTTSALVDLRGKVFAYSDPDSNSGHLFTLYSLLKRRESPSTFFARTFYTWGHRKVVDAVAAGLAQGGAVDGYVWDTLAQLAPALTARTRIVERSPPFGFPPFVARASVSAGDFAIMQRALLQMNSQPDGRALLQRLNLDGFEAGQASLYDSVQAMSRLVDAA